MRHIPFNSKFYKANRNTLYNNIIDNSIILIFSPDTYPKNGDQQYVFIQNSNLYHLCGINQEETILMLSLFDKNQPIKEQLFIKKVEEKQRIWFGEKYSIEKAKELSGINNVLWNEEFKSSLNNIIDKIDNIYFIETQQIKSSIDSPSHNQRQISELKSKYPEKNFIPINNAIADIRLVKQKDEIEAIKKAVKITKDAYYRVLKTLKPGMMEYEVEAEITYEYIKQGANGHAYDPIVASGKNACILHYIDNDKQCLDGDLLLMDFGAEYAYYASDCSRTIPINGKFTEKQAKYYNAVLNVFEKAKKLYTPGNTINNINAKVEKWMEEEMIKLGLFNEEDIKNQDSETPLFKKYFPHGTAHFIGLDVHDVGTKDTEFKAGMVLSCEPGLYIESENIGIRIETDMVVGELPLDLMEDYPVSVEEIEREMV